MTDAERDKGNLRGPSPLQRLLADAHRDPAGEAKGNRPIRAASRILGGVIGLRLIDQPRRWFGLTHDRNKHVQARLLRPRLLRYVCRSWR